MTVHYHGTPITPRSVLETLAGKDFCVSFAAQQDLDWCLRRARSVLADNGAYTLWKMNPNVYTYVWDEYYAWVKPILKHPQNWCIIPDVIGGTEKENDHLIAKWYSRMGSYNQAAPVWHVHESFDRLERLVQGFERVCFGSSGEYKNVGDDKWKRRMNDVFNFLCKGSGSPPRWIHMLRGMSMAGTAYPFTSLDSSDVGRNHNRPENDAKEMADRWDSLQNPAEWTEQPTQLSLDIEIRI